MTTAREREHGPLDERDARLCDLVDNGIRDYNKGRRRRGLKMISQEAIARQVFGRNADWLSKRQLGLIAFTVSELIDIANYLTVDVLDWIQEAKHSPDDTVPGDAAELLPRRDSNTEPFDYQANGVVLDLREKLAKRAELGVAV